MARQSKIVRYGLQEQAVALRAASMSAQQIAEQLNDELAHQDIKDTVTSKAVERFFATLDRATIPEAHQPRVAEQNATLAFDVAKNLELLDGHLTRWIVEADKACQIVKGVVWDENAGEVVSERFTQSDDYDGGPVVPVLVADWNARGTASRELREASKVVADLLQRVYDAQQVQAFQESIMEVLEEADPDVAHKVIAKLKEKQTIRRAALLGVAA